MKIIEAFVLWLRYTLGPHVNYFSSVLRFKNATIQPNAYVNSDCTLGHSVRVYQNAVVTNTAIDSYSYIGGYSKIKNCSIGRFCSIGQNVQIGLGIHPTTLISTYPGFYSTKASGATAISRKDLTEEYKLTRIGHDVWVGNNAIILDGVSLGNGAVVGAGAIVTRDVPAFAIVVGSPAKVVRYRFNAETIEVLEAFEWWSKDIEFLRANCDSFSSEEAFFRMLKSQHDRGDTHAEPHSQA
jgi:acetyltransferase-like isoleucine patch superfamily enzyme